MDEHHLTYRGSSAMAGRFAAELRDEGLDVEWSPPMERRDLASAAESAVIELVVFAVGWTSKQTAEAIRRVVVRWRENRRGTVDWREEDGYR